jgi:hypothetical protein
MTMEEYIATHCVAGTDKVGSQLPIRVIENLSLKIVVLVLTWISGLSLIAPGIEATHVLCGGVFETHCL